MDSPQKTLAEIAALHDRAREAIAEKQFVEGQDALAQALSLDENHAPSYDLMAELFEAQENAEEARTWHDKARAVRRQAWQRQVEAEARGHHDMLGKPGRHEIP